MFVANFDASEVGKFALERQVSITECLSDHKLNSLLRLISQFSALAVLRNYGHLLRALRSDLLSWKGLL